jgi:hypothetical protein
MRRMRAPISSLTVLLLAYRADEVVALVAPSVKFAAW